jgi:MGT family glycosyltransferase
MARILMATITVPGHTNPGLPLARELVERGHDVRWYNSIRFRDKIEATGARFKPLRDGFDLDWSTLDEQFPERRNLKGLALLRWELDLTIDWTIEYVTDLLSILKEEPADVIFTDGGLLAGPTLAELTGLPCAVFTAFPLLITGPDATPVGLGFAPSSTMLGRSRNRLLNWLIFRVVMRSVNAHTNEMRASLGLAPMKETFFDAVVRRADLAMQATTMAFEYPRNDLPDHIHFIGPILPRPPSEFTQPDWWDELHSGRPVVHVTQGTIETEADDLLQPTIDGLADEDVLLVATTGGRPLDGLADGLPANVRLERFIPHGHLLPHVDVMITNGGYGGTQYALAHGIPLVAAGRTQDKPEVCARIAWAGVGIDLKTKSPKPSQVREAVKAVLSEPSYKERAQAIQRDYAQHDAPKRAAELLEELLASNGQGLTGGQARARKGGVMVRMG